MALSLNALPATRAPPPSKGPSPAPWPVWGMGNNQAIQHSLLTKILDSLKGNPPRFTTFQTSTVVDIPSSLNRFQNSFGRGRFFDYDSAQAIGAAGEAFRGPVNGIAALVNVLGNKGQGVNWREDEVAQAEAMEAIELGVFDDWLQGQAYCRGYEHRIDWLHPTPEICEEIQGESVFSNTDLRRISPDDYDATLYRFATGIWYLQVDPSDPYAQDAPRLLFRQATTIEAATIVLNSKSRRTPQDIAWAKKLLSNLPDAASTAISNLKACLSHTSQVLSDVLQSMPEPDNRLGNLITTLSSAGKMIEEACLGSDDKPSEPSTSTGQASDTAPVPAGTPQSEQNLPKAWDASKVSVQKTAALPSKEDPETVTAWDLRNAQPVLGQEVIEPWESFDNCFTTKRIAIYRLGAGKYLRIFKQTESERGYVKTREAETASLVDAKQVLADFQACGLSDIVPDLISNEAFGTASSERTEQGSHSLDADGSLSAEHDKQAASTSDAMDTVRPAPNPPAKSELQEVPRGVSLRDVVLLVNEKDQDGLSRAVRRWSDSKTIKARTLGRCPNDGRALLYELSEILSDARKYFTLSQQKFVAIEKALRFAIRPIKQEESD